MLASKAGAENADKKAGLAEIINWITLDASDKGLQYMWANGTFPGKSKDSVASEKVMATADGKLDFLGGQNDVAVFASMTDSIKWENATIYDQACNEGYQNFIKTYINGTTTKEASLADFYTYINEKYPAVQTP